MTTTMHRRLACLLAATAWLVAARGAVAQEGTIRAGRVRVQEPLDDPEATFWRRAEPARVALLPQTMAMPMNPQPAVQALEVRAAHDGRRLAIRLEWLDATMSDTIVVDGFGDQVAVQLPQRYRKDAVPSPMMGNPGAPVEIWQWRAAFQRDLARGRPTETRDIYPNAHADVYPDEVLRATDAKPYMGAAGVDNLITQAHGSAVLEQVAEGFGTLTIQADDQHARGKGVWRDGGWRVVLTHPMHGGPRDARLAPGSETVAAFAVWDGGNGEVGPKKAWSAWMPVRIGR